MKYTITQDDEEKTVNLTPMKAIRLKCYDCSGFSFSEVRQCTVTGCPLYPYRFGKRPVVKAGLKEANIRQEIKKSVG